MINEPNFTKETLEKLLADNELGQFDPVKEALKVYDPHGAPLAPHRLPLSNRTGWLHPHTKPHASHPGAASERFCQSG